MTYLVFHNTRVAIAYECARRAQRHLDSLYEGGGYGYYLSDALPTGVRLERAVMEAK